MADLRVENPKTTEEYVSFLAGLGVKLPLDFGEDQVVDATGQVVLTVSPFGFRDRQQIEAIAGMIVVAVNTCGGFVASRT